MKSFIGRQNTLSSLNELYQQDEARLVLLHGRRRVGKTRLIHEFTKDKQGVFFFTGVETSEKENKQKADQKIQIKNFLSTLSRLAQKSIYDQVVPTTWDNALGLLDECLPPKGQPCCLVLDELPWMAGNRLDLVRSLFKLWETRWSQRKNFILIVCGSSVGFLDKHFIRSSQFYGRASLSLHLPPLTLSEVVSFFGRSRSFAEILELTMVFGGIPKYLEEITARDSVHQTVNRLCFAADSFFIEEAEHLLRSSFARESDKYKRVIKALVKSESCNYDSLASQANSAKGSSFKRVLDNLVHSDIIERYTPVDKNGPTNFVRFKLSDEFLRFHFVFMEPNVSRIQKNNRGRDLYGLLLPQKKYFVWKGRAFERLIQKHASFIAEKAGIDFVVEQQGSYFSRVANEPQIDLMYVRTDKTITVCEIKYSENPVILDKALQAQIIRQKEFLKTTFKGYRLEHWLITNAQVSDAVKKSDLIQRVINVHDLF